MKVRWTAKIVLAVSLLSTGAHAADVVVSGASVKHNDLVCLLSSATAPQSSTASKDGQVTINPGPVSLTGYRRVVIASRPQLYISSDCAGIPIGAEVDAGSCSLKDGKLQITIQEQPTEYFTIQLVQPTMLDVSVKDTDLGLFTADCYAGYEEVHLQALAGRALIFVPQPQVTTRLKLSARKPGVNAFKVERPTLSTLRTESRMRLKLSRDTPNANVANQAQEAELLITHVPPQ